MSAAGGGGAADEGAGADVPLPYTVFEKRVGEYQKAGVMDSCGGSDSTRALCVDADF